LLLNAFEVFPFVEVKLLLQDPYEVKLKPVNTDDLGGASDLDLEKFLHPLQYSIKALFEGRQGRNYSPLPDVHELCLLKVE
jgi:hypothetical protein